MRNSASKMGIGTPNSQRMIQPALPSRNDCLSRLMIASSFMTLKNWHATVEQSGRRRLFHGGIAKAMPKPRQIVVGQRRREMRFGAGYVRGWTEMTRLHFSIALIRVYFRQIEVAGEKR